MQETKIKRGNETLSDENQCEVLNLEDTAKYLGLKTRVLRPGLQAVGCSSNHFYGNSNFSQNKTIDKQSMIISHHVSSQ